MNHFLQGGEQQPRKDSAWFSTCAEMADCPLGLRFCQGQIGLLQNLKETDHLEESVQILRNTQNHTKTETIPRRGPRSILKNFKVGPLQGRFG